MIDRAKALIAVREFSGRSSDGRFSMLLGAVARPGSKPFTRPITVGDSELKIGSISYAGKNAVLRLGAATPAGFADFLESRIEALYAEFDGQKHAAPLASRRPPPRKKS